MAPKKSPPKLSVTGFAPNAWQLAVIEALSSKERPTYPWEVQVHHYGVTHLYLPGRAAHGPDEVLALLREQLQPVKWREVLGSVATQVDGRWVISIRQVQ